MTGWGAVEYTRRSGACADRCWSSGTSAASAGTSTSRSGWTAGRTATASCSRSTATSPSCRCWRAPRDSTRAGPGSASPAAPLRVPVGEGWLGRVCNGRGIPLDGGPPVLGAVDAPTTGAPLNPLMREPPAEPVLTGISAIDGLATLVRGQKLPVFSVAGLPAPGARHPDRRPGDRRRRAVLRGVRGDGADPRRRRRGPRRAGGAVAGRRAGAAAQHRRRPGHRADPHSPHRAHRRRAPGVHGRPPRPGRDGRHDELRRGAARGVGRPRRDPGAARLPGLPLQRPGVAVRALRTDPRAARFGHGPAGADHARRRHHPPGAGPHRLHHRGPAGAVGGPACPRGLPAGRPAGVAVAADAQGRRARAHPRRPPRPRGAAAGRAGAGPAGPRARRHGGRGRPQRNGPPVHRLRDRLRAPAAQPGPGREPRRSTRPSTRRGTCSASCRGAS